MRSLFRRPRRKCNYQLTKWIRGEENVQFAVEQLEQHGLPYEIRRSRNGMLSVWTYFDELTGDENESNRLERLLKAS
ncbi:MAG TPA: hypothetical protein PLE60_07150 [Candidatus Latescibacteria bacterium]|nr:hypothetical protein [Candidatus Latescibacterota bacterium]HOF62133.1 hypothetical protein [Candidatus Latescibacterota bacterium]HOS64579.1 hypothetical protein [Candidatus Latescibacterota bacterium]HOT36368.1 hypothetical protein [Candidatus Latescibacterota bacterium]HPC43770.1 hypothetical protein [Candidatus Latescibacterota bacterium]